MTPNIYLSLICHLFATYLPLNIRIDVTRGISGAIPLVKTHLLKEHHVRQ